MDIERSTRITRSPIYGKELLKECRRFAEALSNGQWHDNENRRVGIKRDFQEVVAGFPVKNNGITLPEINITTESNFLAQKEVIGVEDDGITPRLEEVYTISVAVKDAIDSSQLPEWIREQLMEQIIEGDEDNEAGDIIEPSEQFLDNFHFTRETEMGYVIDESGDLNDFSMICRYAVDDDEIDKVTYSWAESMEATDLSVVDGKILEYRQSELPGITEEDFEAIRNTFDSIVEAISAQQKFDALEQINNESGLYLDEGDHCRRAMGMLALSSRGMVGMRHFLGIRF